MENLNRYIRQKDAAVRNATPCFASLYREIHRQDDRIFCEYQEEFRIKAVSYSEFDAYCRKAASYLSSRITAPVGSYVGLYGENSPTWIACFWACLMLGYKPMLFNCRLPQEMNCRIRSALKIESIICLANGSLSAENEIVLPASMGLNPEIEKEAPRENADWADEIALTTTATSLNYKVCFYTGKDLTAQVLNARGILKKNRMMQAHDHGRLKQLCFLPFYHIFGLIATYFWFSVFGRTFVFLPDYSPYTILKTARRFRITHLFAVPLFWNTLAREIRRELNRLSEKERKKAERALSLSLRLQDVFPALGRKIARRAFSPIVAQTLGDSVKFLISGGGAISEDTISLLNEVGYPLFNGYGATEIGITSVELRKTARARMKATVGQSFDSVSYRIQDGCLQVRGSSLCSRILTADGKETEVAKNEWFDTGDCATLDRRGYLRILGRRDDVTVDAGGEKINPDVWETKCRLTETENYCLISYQGGLCLICEIKSTATPIKLRQIYDQLSETVKRLCSEGCRLSGVYYTNDSLRPPTAIKVSRRLLQKRIADGEVRLLPISMLERETHLDSAQLSQVILDRIRGVFASALNRDASEIGDTMHFIFDLGGTSLDFCALLMQLKDEFGTELPESCDHCSTVREFADCIINQGTRNER